ncbi:hypothetical protein [Pseudomonas sp. O39]|uniref:hypothetical protein n=1 Tax=Pseudomonas sp. O39 TaxID=3379130 RepID=UPI00387AD1EE
MDANEHRLYDRIKSNILNEDIGEEYERFIIKNKRRKMLTWLIFLIFCLIFIFATLKIINPSLVNSFNSTLIIISIMAISLGAAILNYLEPSTRVKNDSNTPDNLNRLKSVEKQLFELRLLLRQQQKNETQNFTTQDKERVISNIQAKLESEALSDYISGIKQILTNTTKAVVLEDQFSKTTLRLSLEIDNLAKRGNLNLFLGIMTTLIGLSALAYSVFNSPSTQSPEELLVHFIPRVSLVLLIEVFAYFFLRLYKQSLSEIKYFQNEITNIESKQIATNIAINNKAPKPINQIINTLSKTERNFVLNKGQTTIDLERERLSNQTNTNALNTLKTVLTNKKQ